MNKNDSTPIHAADSPVALSLREHQITFVLPAGARLVGDLDLPNGGLIIGEFIGDVHCRGEGSLIIEKKGHVRGRIVANRIYVKGRVSSGATPSQLVGRTLVAVSAGSEVTADVFAGTTKIASSAFNGMIHTIDDLNKLPPRVPTVKLDKLGQFQLTSPGLMPTTLATLNPAPAPAPAQDAPPATTARRRAAPAPTAATDGNPERKQPAATKRRSWGLGAWSLPGTAPAPAPEKPPRSRPAAAPLASANAPASKPNSATAKRSANPSGEA